MSGAQEGSAGRRDPCEPCKKTPHTAADCADRLRPMCQRACPCGHGEADRDPSPFWTSMQISGTDAADESGSMTDHVAATNGRWRLSPLVERSATRGDVQ